MTKFWLGALGLIAVAVAITVAPDVQRYLKIRAM